MRRAPRKAFRSDKDLTESSPCGTLFLAVCIIEGCLQFAAVRNRFEGFLPLISFLQPRRRGLHGNQGVLRSVTFRKDGDESEN